MPLRALLVLLAFSRVAIAAAPPPGYSPARASSVVRGYFRLPEANCEVPTPPGDGWQWFVGPASNLVSAYACVNAISGEILSVGTNRIPATAISSSFLEQAMDGAREGLSQHGCTIAQFRSAVVQEPVLGTVRFTYSLRAADGPTSYAFSYAVPTGYNCLLAMGSTRDEEPPALVFAARGLRLLKRYRPEELFPELAAALSPAPSLLFGAVSYGLAIGFGILRRRPVNPWSGVIVVLVLLACFNLVVLKRADIFEDLAPKDRNRLVLLALAGPTLGLTLSYWLRGRRTACTNTDA